MEEEDSVNRNFASEDESTITSCSTICDNGSINDKYDDASGGNVYNLINFEDDNSSTISEDDNSSTIIEDGNSSTIIEDGNSSTIIEDGNSSTIIEDSNSSTIIEDGNSSTIIEDGNSSTIIEDGNSSIIIEDSNISMIIEDSNSSTIIEDRNSSTKYFNLDEDKITSNFEENESFYSNGDKNVNAEMIHANDDNSRNFEIDDSYVNLHDYVFDDETSHNGRVDDIRNRNCDENDDDMIKNYETKMPSDKRSQSTKANDSKRAEIKNRPPDVKNPSNNDDNLKKCSNKYKKLKIHPQKVPNNECDKKKCTNKKSKSQNHDQQVVDSQKHPYNDGKFTTKLLNKEIKPLKGAVESDISSKKDSKGKSNKKITSKEDNDTQISLKGATDSKISAKKDVRFKISSKKDVGFKISSKKDVGFKISSKKDVGFKISSKEDVGFQISSKKDVGFQISSKKDVGFKISSKEDVGFQISSKKYTDSKSCSNGESNKKISSNEDDNSQIISKEDGDPKTSSTEDGDPKTSSKGDGISKISLKGDGDLKTSTKGDGDLKTSTKGDGDLKTSTKGDGNSKITSKEDGNSKISSKGDGNSKISSKGDGNSKISSKGDGNSKISSKGDGNSKISSKGDGNSKISAMKDVGSKIGSNNDASKKNVSNKEDESNKCQNKASEIEIQDANNTQLQINETDSSSEEEYDILRKMRNPENPEEFICVIFPLKSYPNYQLPDRYVNKKVKGFNSNKRNINQPENEESLNLNPGSSGVKETVKYADFGTKKTVDQRTEAFPEDQSLILKSKKAKHCVEIAKTPSNPSYIPEESTPPSSKRIRSKFHCFRCNLAFSSDLSLDVHKVGIHNMKVKRQDWEHSSEEPSGNASSSTDSFLLNETVKTGNQVPDFEQSRRESITTIPDTDSEKENIIVNVMKSQIIRKENESGKQLPSVSCREMNFTPKVNASRTEKFLSKRQLFNEDDRNSRINSKRNANSQELEDSPPKKRCSLELHEERKIDLESSPELEIIFESFNSKQENKEPEEVPKKKCSFNSTEDLEIVYEHLNLLVKYEKYPKSVSNLVAFDNDPKKNMNSCKSSNKHKALTSNVSVILEDIFKSGNLSSILKKNGVSRKSGFISDAINNGQLPKKGISSNKRKTLPSNATIILEDIEKSGNLPSILKRNGVKMSRPNFDLHMSSQTSETVPNHIDHNYVRLIENNSPQPTTSTCEEDIDQSSKSFKDYNVVHSQTVSKNVSPKKTCDVQNLSEHIEPIQASSSTESDDEPSQTVFENQKSTQDETENCEPIGQILLKTREPSKFIQELHNLDESLNEICEQRQTASEDPKSNQVSQDLSEKHKPCHGLKASLKSHKIKKASTKNQEPNQVLSGSLKPNQVLSESLKPNQVLSESLKPNQVLSESLKPNQTSTESHKTIEASSQRHKVIESSSESHETIKATSQSQEPNVALLENDAEASETVFKNHNPIGQILLKTREPSKFIQELHNLDESLNEICEQRQTASEDPKSNQASQDLSEKHKPCYGLKASLKSHKIKKASTKNQQPNQVLSESLKPNQVLSESLKPNQVLSESLKPNQVLSESLKPNQVLSESLKPNQVLSESLKPNQTSSESLKPNQTSSESHKTIEASSQRHKVIESSSESHETIEATSQSQEPNEALLENDAEASETVFKNHKSSQDQMENRDPIGQILLKTREPSKFIQELHNLDESLNEICEQRQTASEDPKSNQASQDLSEKHKPCYGLKASLKSHKIKKASTKNQEPNQVLSESLKPNQVLSESLKPNQVLSESLKPNQTSTESHKTIEASSQRHKVIESSSESHETIEATSQSQEPNEALLENDAEASETVFKNHKSSQDQMENRDPIGQILLKARDLELNNCDKTLTSSKDPKSNHASHDLGENPDHSQAVLKIHKPSHNVSDKQKSSQKGKQTKQITSQNLSSNNEVFPPEINSYQANNLSPEDVLTQNAINVSLKRKRIPTVEKPRKMRIATVQTSKNSTKALKVISNCIPQNKNDVLKFKFQVIEGRQKYSGGPKSGECPYCKNKVGNTEWDVKNHVLESHRHKCGFCKQLFQTEEEYTQHKYNSHMNQLHECIICDDYFQSIAIYDRHVKTVSHKKMELKANKIIRSVIRDTLHIELPPDEISTPNKPNKLERVTQLNPNITRIPHKNVWIERVKETISKALQQNHQNSRCSSERTSNYSSVESRRLSSYSSEGNLSPVSSENFDREDYVRLNFEEFQISRNFLVKDCEIQDLLKKFEMVTYSNADELDCSDPNIDTDNLNPLIEDQSTETPSLSLNASQFSLSSPDNLNQSPNTSQITQNDDKFEDYLENRGSSISTQNVIDSVPIFNDTIKTPGQIIDENSMPTLNTPVINRSESPNIIEVFCKSGWDSNYVMHNMAEFNKMWNG